MNNDEPQFNSEQASALTQLRVRWAVALLLNLPLPFIALPIVGSDWINQEPTGQAGQSMMLAVVLGLAALITGHVARSQTYKAHWQGEVITPPGYVKANTFFFASITFGALALFVLSLVGPWPAPVFAAALPVLGLLILNFPNGRPMLPAPPRPFESLGD